jgi:outer membrane protein assembly factor BamB
LKGADGSEVKTYAGSERCEEIVVHGNTLLALCLIDKGPLNDMDAERGSKGVPRAPTQFPLFTRLAGSAMSPQWLHAERRLIAYDRNSGKQRWCSEGAFAPLSLATDGKRVYAHNGTCLKALDLRTGKNLWRSEPVPIWKDFFSFYGASLVVHEDVVLFSGGENTICNTGNSKSDDTMTAVSAITGKKLWTGAHPPSGFRSSEDLFVAQGLVWAPSCLQKSTLNGLDPKTGAVKRTIEVDLEQGFHHRCYTGRATEQYMLLSKAGVNTVPFDGKGPIVNDQWVRGACGYGFMPANGLIYATPDPCNCFPEAKLNGFAGLAPADVKLDAYRREALKAIKVEKGESFSGTLPRETGGWPTYRADAGRTGTTQNVAPTSFKPAWKASFGGRLSAPVVAGDMVYVSRIDQNQVVALDSASGKTAWTYVTGSRVDSPPTVVGPLLYFGAADGYVTCLEAKTGAMVWRRRLAPTDEKIVDEGRLESVWPVHGSVTYHNNLIYAIAGRNMFVDGGVHLCALDPRTGEAQYSRIHARKPTETYGLQAMASKPDILAASGNHLFMRSLIYDLEGNQLNVQVRHIYAVNGYLNDSWFHRAFWTYAPRWIGGYSGFGKTGNANHSGRIMINDGTAIYGFGRSHYRWSSSFSYKLYRAPVAVDAGKTEPIEVKKISKGSKTKSGTKKHTWSIDIPVLARSLVKAGDKLIIIGPRKLYEEKKAIQKLEDPSTAGKIKAQAESWDKTADLLVISAADGKMEQRVSFDFAPVWDGVAIAEEALFLSATEGTVYRLQ